MKPHLPVSLLAAVLGACALTATATEKTLHVYILTGQSNSLGAVKGSPASEELLEQYSTAGTSNIQMWNGNVNKGKYYYSDCTLHDDDRRWMTVAPQKPDTSAYSNTPCMGPEYGFSYMMTKKGWQVDENSTIAIVKSSLDGGGNSYWLAHSTDSQLSGNENQATPFYNQLLDTVKEALNALDASAYDRIELDGLLYLQGESNSASEASAAATRYTELLANLKADLSSQGYSEEILNKLTVSFDNSVVGQPATWTDTTKTTYSTTSAQKLYAASQESEDIGWVFTRDLDKITSGDDMGVHYDGKSQITIGARYAYAMALVQGWDVGNVRSDYYNNWDYNGSTVSLNDANAWWSGKLPDADAVVSWDVSSANQEDTLSGDFAVGGIKVEDPFRDTVVIKNLASDTNATLSIGASGITLEGSNLSLQTNVSATADQIWNIAAGKTLELTHGLDAAQRTITITGGDSASVSLAGSAQIGALSLSGNVALNIGTADAIGNVTIDTWYMGDSASISLSIVGEEASSLHVNQFNYTSDSSTVTITLENCFAPSDPFNQPEYSFIIGDGWDDWDINGSGNRTISFSNGIAYDGWVLTNDNGTLVLSSPSRTEQVINTTSNTYDVSAAAGKSSGYINALVKERTGTGDLYIYACNQAGYAGNVYAEIQDIPATWLVAVGKGSSKGERLAASGSFNLKVSASSEAAPAVGYTQIFGACNAAVDGDIFLEFDNPNATYASLPISNVAASISGAYNSTANNVTLVFNAGTVEGNIVAARNNSSISGAATIELNGGTVNGSIYGGYLSGGSGSNSVHESIVTITGGAVSGNIYGLNDSTVGGTVNLQDLGIDSSFAAYNGSIKASGLNITNSAVTAGSITINNGTLEVGAGSSLDISGNLAITSGGNAELSGDGRVETSTLAVTASSASSTLEIGLDSLTVRGDRASSVAGMVSMTAGNHSFTHVAFSTTMNKGISINGGTTTFANCVFGNSAATTESGNAILWVADEGKAILEDGTVVYGNAGVQSGGTLEIADGANVTAGKLYHSSSLDSNGALVIGQDATLALNYTESHSNIKTVTNQGTLRLEGHTINIGTLDNDGMIDLEGGTLRLTRKTGQTEYNMGSIHASGDAAICMNDAAAGNVTFAVEELKLSEGAAFSAYNNTTGGTAHEAGIQTLALAVDGAATLNANLILGNASGAAWTLNLGGTVEMGSDLTLYSGGAITLGENIWTGNTATLFTSVDNLFLNGEAITEEGFISAGEIFSNAAESWQLSYIQASDSTWTLSLTVPEPSTATLSLLGLAALARRRKRPDLQNM